MASENAARRRPDGNGSAARHARGRRAAPAAAAPTPPPYPAMSPTLAADANSPTFDLGLLGHKVTISGAVTGLGIGPEQSRARRSTTIASTSATARSSSTRPTAYSNTSSRRASIRSRTSARPI